MFSRWKKNKQIQDQAGRDALKELLREVIHEETQKQVEAEQAEQIALLPAVFADGTQPEIAPEEPVQPLEVVPSELDDDNEPKFVIKSIGHDPEKGIRIETDWNEAFVRYLRAQGYTGTSDEQVIQRYIAMVAKQIADRVTPNAPESNEYV